MAAARPQVSIAPVGVGPTTLTRAPAHDSASIESHRLGGNFAYATAEAHAFAQVTPQISRATFPVAETTYTHEPETIAHITPAKIVTTNYAHKPVIGQEAVYGTQPVIGPVAKHTTVHQPIFKQQHVTYTQPAPVVEQTVTAVQPAVHAVAAPAAIGYAGHGYAAAAPAAVGYAAAPVAALGHAGIAAAPAVAAIH